MAVDNVFNDVHSFTGLSLVVGTVFFSFQIFCDFSGYSDMAIGAAQVMGIKLMTNFRRPYLASTISDFWSRWHISLSTWFRDYVYIPLGGNRVSTARWNVNLFIVFMLSGVWHGANWTFIIWGALHGFYVVFANSSKSIREQAVQKLGLMRAPHLYKGLNILLTFLLATFAWIFFRANTVQDAFYVVRNLFTGWKNVLTMDYLQKFNAVIGVDKSVLILGILLIAGLGVINRIQEKYGSIRELIATRHWMIRWGIYYGFAFALLLLRTNTDKQFIYFQF